MEPFNGLSEAFYQFLWDIAFHNEIGYFEENRERYNRDVKQPLLLLAESLSETALAVDRGFYVKPGAVVSRIRRDTRYAPIDAPYRDHAYLTYRYPGVTQGESFVIYVEFMRDSYGYGMGIYGLNPPFMAQMRKRILARKEMFLQLIHAPAFKSDFVLEGESYKRPKYTQEEPMPAEWLNKRRFYYSHISHDIKSTFRPQVLEEIKIAFLNMKPLYRFIMGLD
ncbi:MAG: DUF2461 domain-containing protein [Clostridiales bacterium]|jgi:uncharacterized protein (TIGR02453 family)|nr:DUF2461 domain-containing protein [Clostridiales bacterium]